MEGIRSTWPFASPKLSDCALNWQNAPTRSIAWKPSPGAALEVSRQSDGGKEVIARVFMAGQDEGFSRVWWGGEGASNATHDGTEEWGVPQLFRVAGVPPQCLTLHM